MPLCEGNFSRKGKAYIEEGDFFGKKTGESCRDT